MHSMLLQSSGEVGIASTVTAGSSLRCSLVVPARVHSRRVARVIGVVVGTLSLVVAAAMLGACTSSTAAQDSSTSTAPPLPPAPAPSPVVWTACPSQNNLQCGSVSVPVNYRHPDGPSIQIALTREPAMDPAKRIGTLLFNPGGPGESGNQILPVILNLLPTEITQRFDVVSFDPRGTGASNPLDCGTNASAISSLLPVPTAPNQPLPGAAAFTAMAQACEQQYPSFLSEVNSTNTARDMDRIRIALGQQQISYYGLSYGTELGTVYASLFPHRLRAMVLDGAVDVNASLATQAADEAPAIDRSLQHFFTTCAADPSCPLQPDPQAKFEALTASLTAHPLPAPGNGDNYPVTVGDLDTATLLYLSAPKLTELYPLALADAIQGNGAPLRELALELDQDLDGVSLIDAQWAITCNDAASHPDALAAGAQARSLQARYPLLGGYAVTYNLGGCVAWPRALQPVVDLHPTGTPPILVIGNTGDPNTPLVGSLRLAADIPSAVQVTWDGWGHTWLLNGSQDDCMQTIVNRYLLDGHLPPRGTTCR